ncbi:MAG: alpha/beta fold hydrolase [Gammaproteobacteria bacterium]|nr:alpha/beta fold hydrolase [Gammaproteobacteria bacterium]
MSLKYNTFIILLLPIFLASCTPEAVITGNDSDILLEEHYVSVVSRVPSMTGSVSNIYVRERVLENVRNSNDLEGQVVLFIHGAGTPAEVAFDVPVPGYSWMAYLAERGMDAFSMDMTGYGRSTRPLVMNDRCNLTAEQQEALFGDACLPSYAFATTSMASDWNDIDGVVNYLRELRGVEKVHLVGWSQGGPRSGGYAAMHPDKVGNMVMLAPAYRSNVASTQAEADFSGAALTKQDSDDFVNNWNRQVGCDDQYDPAVSEAVWSEMLASDPVGTTWGSGVRRAPRAITFGWGAEVVANTAAPLLMVAGTQDAQIAPQIVQNLYADYGGQKFYLEMACSSHNAMWERDAQQLYEASYEWLNTATYNGMSNGSFVLD